METIAEDLPKKSVVKAILIFKNEASSVWNNFYFFIAYEFHNDNAFMFLHCFAIIWISKFEGKYFNFGSISWKAIYKECILDYIQISGNWIKTKKKFNKSWVF